LDELNISADPTGFPANAAMALPPYELARLHPSMPLKHDDDQNLLFGDGPAERAMEMVPPATVPPDVIANASRIPSSVHFGTSSWAFPGWRGIVFTERARADQLARRGLAAYARHPLFRTVGLDRAFYSLTSERDAQGLAALVPDGFRFLVKAHQSVTRPDADGAGGAFGNTREHRTSGIANPRFLDPAWATDKVVGPAVAGFGNRLGPIVFQFPPLALERFGGSSRFIDQIARFLAALPRGPIMAVEVRNRELFLPPAIEQHAAALASAHVAHGFAVHPTLPRLSSQVAALDAAGWPIERQPAVCVRWLLGHGHGYDEAKLRYEPFDKIVEPDPVSRETISAILGRAIPSARLSWIIANNKAEGSAPLTLLTLARTLFSPDQ